MLYHIIDWAAEFCSWSTVIMWWCLYIYLYHYTYINIYIYSSFFLPLIAGMQLWEQNAGRSDQGHILCIKLDGAPEEWDLKKVGLVGMKLLIKGTTVCGLNTMISQPASDWRVPSAIPFSCTSDCGSPCPTCLWSSIHRTGDCAISRRLGSTLPWGWKSSIILWKSWKILPTFQDWYNIWDEMHWNPTGPCLWRPIDS